MLLSWYSAFTQHSKWGCKSASKNGELFFFLFFSFASAKGMTVREALNDLFWCTSLRANHKIVQCDRAQRATLSRWKCRTKTENELWPISLLQRSTTCCADICLQYCVCIYLFHIYSIFCGPRGDQWIKTTSKRGMIWLDHPLCWSPCAAAALYCSHLPSSRLGTEGRVPPPGSSAVHTRGDTGLVQYMTWGRLWHARFGWLLGISTQFNEFLRECAWKITTQIQHLAENPCKPSITK